MSIGTRLLQGLMITALLGMGAGCGQEEASKSVAHPNGDPSGVHRPPTHAAFVASRNCSPLDPNRSVVDAGEALRRTFVAESSARVRLLLEGTQVRPGARLHMALENHSDHTVFHGEFNHIENAETGRTVRIKGPYGIAAPAFGVEPGRVGTCVVAPVPSSTPAGRYRAVLEDVGRNLRTAHRDLSAEFEVSGPPIPHPPWEVAIHKAAVENLHRRQFDRLKGKAQAAPSGADPLLCPRASGAAFNARRIFGKALGKAERIAKRHGCVVQVVELNSHAQRVSGDLRPNRIDVAVRRGFVTRVLLVG